MEELHSFLQNRGLRGHILASRLARRQELLDTFPFLVQAGVF
jgi:hypothetical protein